MNYNQSILNIIFLALSSSRGSCILTSPHVKSEDVTVTTQYNVTKWLRETLKGHYCHILVGRGCNSTHIEHHSYVNVV